MRVIRTACSGTTTATVLTRAIFSEGCKSVAAGMNPMDLRRGINMAVERVVEELKGRAKMISTTEEIAQVGPVGVARPPSLRVFESHRIACGHPCRPGPIQVLGNREPKAEPNGGLAESSGLSSICCMLACLVGFIRVLS